MVPVLVPVNLTKNAFDTRMPLKTAKSAKGQGENINIYIRIKYYHVLKDKNRQAFV